jgi:hypothetical protein
MPCLARVSMVCDGGGSGARGRRALGASVAGGGVETMEGELVEDSGPPASVDAAGEGANEGDPGGDDPAEDGPGEVARGGVRGAGDPAVAGEVPAAGCRAAAAEVPAIGALNGIDNIGYSTCRKS